MILNITVPEHKPAVLAGTKIHSMREDKHNRWKVGMTIHFSTGARTKNYNQFSQGKCLGLQKVGLYQGSVGIMVLVDGRQLLGKEILEVARNDGYADIASWMRFFVPEIPEDPNDMNQWTGKIIHWTDKLY